MTRPDKAGIDPASSALELGASPLGPQRVYGAGGEWFSSSAVHSCIFGVHLSSSFSSSSSSAFPSYISVVHHSSSS